MKIKATPFKSWDEQIEKLNQLGNNFLDRHPKDKQKILRYLKNYNFQISVNAFTPLLWNNLNDGIEEKNLHFIHNFQFDDLIELFKFDRLLKDTINKLLQNVENKLRDGIIYHLLESIHTICSNNINLPFILLDDDWSEIIGRKVFINNLSGKSFIDKNNEFMFDDYYTFLSNYIEPFKLDGLFLKNVNLKNFYFYKVISNHAQLESLNNFTQYKSTNKSNKFIPFEIEDSSGKKIYCTYHHFFAWCKQNKNIPAKFKDDENTIENSTIQGMINVLAKSFIPLYKSFTQIAFCDMIKLFSKLNETIQLKIIKEHFPCFYQKINSLITDKKNGNLILISSFICFLTLFKDVRNKIAHLDIIYNFWDLHAPNISRLGRNVIIKSYEFWLANKQTCNFLNELLNAKNTEFLSNYFKDKFINKDSFYYLNKINNLGIKVYCKNKNNTIYFTDKSDDKNIWLLPMFFLKDAIEWLLVFANKNKKAKNVIEQCLNHCKIKNNEIKNRMHDYLFNKIIISLEKIKND